MRYEPIRQFQDRGLQRLLASPVHLRELLALCVPEVAAALVPQSLRNLSPVLIGADLGLSSEDVLWAGRLRSGARVRFLVAHQSAPDPLLGVRLHRAVATLDDLLLEEQAAAGVTPARRRLDVVVPIVVVTGRRPWSPLPLRELRGEDELLEAFAHDLSSRVLDVRAEEPDSLLARGGGLGCMLAVYRAQHEPLLRLEAALDRALAALHARRAGARSTRESRLALTFFCYQIVWNRRGPEESAMLEHVFARHIGRKEARVMGQTAAEAEFARGEVSEARSSALEVLEFRFGKVPLAIRRALRGIEDLRRLRALRRTALSAGSLEAFGAALALQRDEQAGRGKRRTGSVREV